MNIWPTYHNFSAEFREQNRNLVLYDTLHHIQALLLYHPNCDCGRNCNCAEQRRKIVLSLNLALFERIRKERGNSDGLGMLREFLKIPEDAYFFRENWNDAFPLRFIMKELQQKEVELKRVDQIVWIFLRLAKTSESFGGGGQTSISESARVIQGNLPIKKARLSEGLPILGCDKFYTQNLDKYKSICHLIAAFQLHQNPSIFSSPEAFFTSQTPENIDLTLKRAHWIRHKLITTKITKSKEGKSFPQRVLKELPDWVEYEDFSNTLESVEKKQQELEKESSASHSTSKQQMKCGN